MKIVLVDDKKIWLQLLPLTFTRPVSEIRIGILTIREKWEKVLKTKISYLCEGYLSDKFAIQRNSNDDTVYILSHLIPDSNLISVIKKLKVGQGIKQQGELIAFNGGKNDFNSKAFLNKSIEYKHPLFDVRTVSDIFRKNGKAIEMDFALLTKGRKSTAIAKSNTVIGKRNLIFMEKGTKAEAAIFNTSGGPIYIGRNAEVMEGSVIRGPFVLGDESTLKLAAKIYGPTTIGPHCKVGGEVNNSVVFGFSNKAHDGFLGNSVIGEWCNLGADTNNSNLKNNYGNVKLFSYVSGKNEDTGLQFCGLIMGDHSKSGINTMFNTGTVVGVAANVFGGLFPETHIPSFSWGGSHGWEPYLFDKMIETAEKVFERRGMKLEIKDKKILKHISEITAS